MAAPLPSLPPLTTWDDVPLDLKMAVVLALGELDARPSTNFQMAGHYLASIGRAIQRFPGELAWEAVQSNLLYALQNLDRWRGDRARSSKQVFRAYIAAVDHARRTRT